MWNGAPADLRNYSNLPSIHRTPELKQGQGPQSPARRREAFKSIQYRKQLRHACGSIK